MADPEKLFKVNVVTPDGLVYSHRSSIIDMRAVDGRREIMYNHAPILTPLAIADVKVKRSREMSNEVDHIAVNGGYIEFSNNVATIIADSAERARNIDVSRAEAAKERAEKNIKEARQKKDQQSLERAQVALRRAVNRINVYNTIK
ncbi:F0F1 ATP synthase subunit epsilon [Lactobacillus kalixensis]|uniref:ATP synthase epsilon chain n=1 Tax=Lactobacillus kalixensis DSM 16043 TaxID=1423763 RepID=A0A0R1UKB0_9LACO|nr:F0F1 ATP synthase subunit epsilon [Lactobacillus kalixensis]KRL91381.1 ATP synthase F1 sector epsilon subunit [Lactobacillus kalixensis DSM 16043]